MGRESKREREREEVVPGDEEAHRPVQRSGPGVKPAAAAHFAVAPQRIVPGAPPREKHAALVRDPQLLPTWPL